MHHRAGQLWNCLRYYRASLYAGMFDVLSVQESKYAYQVQGIIHECTGSRVPTACYLLGPGTPYVTHIEIRAEVGDGDEGFMKPQWGEIMEGRVIIFFHSGGGEEATGRIPRNSFPIVDREKVTWNTDIAGGTSKLQEDAADRCCRQDEASTSSKRESSITQTLLRGVSATRLRIDISVRKRRKKK